VQCWDTGWQSFDSLAFFLIAVAPVKVVVAIQANLPEVSPEMVQSEFEPSVPRLLCRINARFVHDMSSLNLSPLFAELTFEKMLPSDFVLGIDKGSKDRFSVVGIHLEVLIGESVWNALWQNESKIKLCGIGDKCVTQVAEELGTPQ
jgi:hypothetical protein